VATNTSLGVLATNVFLTKITNSIGTTNAVIAWSAVFGGKGADIGNGVAVDPAGNVFVTGSASSTNFPTYNVPGLMMRNYQFRQERRVRHCVQHHRHHRRHEPALFHLPRRQGQRFWLWHRGGYE
jgi:hypothetical protein